MTSLVVVPPVSRHAVSWTRLAWVSWRRYRAMLVTTIGVLLLLGGYVLVDGLALRSAYSAYLDCAPTDSARCQFAWMNFREGHGQSGFLVIILTILPGIVGAFVGAPQLARELETGSFRYTWTQGVGRVRWAAAVIIPGALGVALLLGAFGILVAWHNQPLAAAGIVPRLRPTSFAVTGIAPAGWALLAFALGVLAGLLWRRVLPALATAFAAWFGIAFLTATVLRPRYLSPLTTTQLDLPAGDLSLSQWWTADGVRVDDNQITSVLQAAGLDNVGTVTVAAGAGANGNVDPVQYLLEHGYTQVTSYQPDGRFWTFQWIEFGWLVAVSALLLAASIWLVRRATT